MKLATLLFAVSLVVSFSALAQAPIAQDKPVASPAVQQCSLNEEICLALSGDGSFELRYMPKAKSTKKVSTRAAKMQVIAFRLLATCGGGSVVEWISTSQSKKSTKQSVLRVTTINGITGIAVPTAEFTKSEGLANATPETATQNVQLKKLQGRFLAAITQRLVQLSHAVASDPQKPLALDPVLAQDIVTLFATSQKHFYSVAKAKKAKEPAAIEPVREDVPKADTIPPAVVKPMPMPVEKGM